MVLNKFLFFVTEESAISCPKSEVVVPDPNSGFDWVFVVSIEVTLEVCGNTLAPVPSLNNDGIDETVIGGVLLNIETVFVLVFSVATDNAVPSFKLPKNELLLNVSVSFELVEDVEVAVTELDVGTKY